MSIKITDARIQQLEGKKRVLGEVEARLRGKKEDMARMLDAISDQEAVLLASSSKDVQARRGRHVSLMTLRDQADSMDLAIARLGERQEVLERELIFWGATGYRK